MPGPAPGPGRVGAPGRFAPGGAWVMAFGVFAGLLLPDLAALLRPGLGACVAALLLLAMLRIRWSLGGGSGLLLLLLAGAWLLIVNPVLAWAVTRALGMPGELVVPVVLMCAAPPILSAPSLALLVRLDEALMLRLVTLVTLVSPLTLALVPGALLGLELQVDPLVLMARLFALIGGALVLALGVQRVAGASRLRRWSGALDALALLLLVGFAIGIMDGVAGLLRAHPQQVLWLVALAFAANLVLQLAGGLLFRPAGTRAAVAIGFASGNRNMGLLIAVLPLASGSQTLLWFALAQFPMYIMPAVLAPLYARLSRNG